MKFGFYVSGKASRLIDTIAYLMEHDRRAPSEYIDFVVADNDNPELRELSARYGFELVEVDYKTAPLEGRKKSVYLSALLLARLQQGAVPYLFVFGNKILSGELLSEYHNRIINFHPSVLPAFPGLLAIDQARARNAFLMGNTAHFIDEGVDTGPVIMQHLMHHSAFNGYSTVLDAQVLMLRQIMCWLDQERIAVNDRDVVVRGASYAIGAFVPNIEL